ncbi:MAG: carboxypeptidase-like regulatory domain-containing protein, partial [Saprospiraceae bacterium]|nr:carboxypeptidase-like regulatory domain-containing protein [Saprospiraceae bacterium]
MNKRWITLFSLLVIAQFIYAQGVKGFLKDENNQPLSYATVFVQENKSGAATNENGYYEINLPSGSYNITYQYLGYQSETQKVGVGNTYKEINITLMPQSFDLKTVEVLDGREDPAYTIMRKAIAKATYHREQVEHYTAMVYVKGSGRMLDSPFFLEKLMEKEGIDSTSAFLGETVSQIEYSRPNDYKELVKKIRQQGNDNSTSPMAYITNSFYEPELVEVISPLSPRAFGFYKFSFEGSYIEDGIEINKIKVTPRNRGEGVFEGYISIVEDDWAIHSLDLLTHKLGIRVAIKQLYKPILPSVWMPINHRFDIKGSFFGFDFVYDYYATVNDYKVELNPDLGVEFDVIDESIVTPPPTADKETPKELEDIKRKMESGEELTRKDLRKMMKEYQKEDRKQMEEPEVVSNYSQTIDSTAYNKDSSYWASIRPIPLTKYEVRSYEKVDSIAIVEKAEKDSAVAKNEENERNFKVSHLLFGNTYRLDSNDYLRIIGPIASFEINTVEEYAFNYPILDSNDYLRIIGPIASFEINTVEEYA